MAGPGGAQTSTTQGGQTTGFQARLGLQTTCSCHHAALPGAACPSHPLPCSADQEKTNPPAPQTTGQQTTGGTTGGGATGGGTPAGAGGAGGSSSTASVRILNSPAGCDKPCVQGAARWQPAT